MRLPSLDFIRCVTFITFAMALSGCMPRYIPDSATPHTQIQTHNINSMSICVRGEEYSLSLDSNGVGSIPTGSAIGLSAYFSTSDGQVMHSCRPEIGFTPKVGTSYISIIHFVDRSCSLQLFRKNPATSTGLDWEYSVRKGGCAAPK